MTLKFSEIRKAREWRRNHDGQYLPGDDEIDALLSLIDRARPLVEWVANECDDAFDCMNNTHERARQFLKDTEQ